LTIGHNRRIEKPPEALILIDAPALTVIVALHKVEHRLFSFITMNWKARPLVSYRVIVDLISATTTDTGLTVRCELDSADYPKGIVVSDREMDGLNISRDAFHGEWNYTMQPNTPSVRALVSG